MRANDNMIRQQNDNSLQSKPESAWELLPWSKLSPGLRMLAGRY